MKRKAFIVFLLVFIFVLPVFMYRTIDSHMLETEEVLQMEVAQYKNGSLEDHLYTLIACSEEDNYLQGVEVEEMAAVSQEELTEIINQELKNLFDISLLGNRIILKQESLKERKLYTTYFVGNDDLTSKMGSSMKLWKVLYQYEDENYFSGEVEILMDMEYHKIYDIRLVGNKGDFNFSLKEEKSPFICEQLQFYYDNNSKMNEIHWVTMEKSEKSEKSQSTAIMSTDSSKDVLEYDAGCVFFNEEEEYILRFVKEISYLDGQCILHLGIADLDRILKF